MGRRRLAVAVVGMVLVASQASGDLQLGGFNCVAPSRLAAGETFRCTLGPSVMSGGPVSPQGTVIGTDRGHEHVDTVRGERWRFFGTPGQTTGWVIQAAAGPVCGDAILNQQSEQCDGTALSTSIPCDACTGACQCVVTTPTPTPTATGTAATPTFTAGGGAPTATPSASVTPTATFTPGCGNGVKEAGEACDPTDDVTGICADRCTAGCQCQCFCGDGQVDVGCTSGTDEECESGGTAASFGNAVQFAGNNATALKDSVAGRSTFDFTSTPFTVCVHVVVSTPAIRWWVDFGAAIGNSGNGWAFRPSSDGSFQLVGSDTDTGKNNATRAAISSTGVILAGQSQIACGTRSGGTGALYLATDGDAALTDVTSDGTILNPFTSNAGLLALAIGNRSGLGGSVATSDAIDQVLIFDAALSKAQLDAIVFDPVTGSEPNLVFAAKLDEPAGSLSFGDSSPTGATLTAVGSGYTAGVPSTFTPATSGGGGLTGCDPGETCNPSLCTCATTGDPGSRILYVSPPDGAVGGNDAFSGLSPSTPWLHPSWAIDPANPRKAVAGDTIHLLGGTYTLATTGFIRHVAGTFNPDGNTGGVCDGLSGATAPCGTAANPITYFAERDAIFDTDGVRNGVYIQGAKWIVVDGLVVEHEGTAQPPSSDLNPGGIKLDNVADVTVKKAVVRGSNSVFDGHGIRQQYSSRTAFEDSEIYGTHRHAFSCFNSESPRFHRLYTNRRYAAPIGPDSQEAVVSYGCRGGFYEDIICENGGNCVTSHGGGTWQGNEGSGQQFFNVICLNEGSASRIDSRAGTLGPLRSVTMRNVVFAHNSPTEGGGNHLRVTTVDKFNVSDATFFGTTGTGFSVKDSSSNNCATIGNCSITGNRLLFIGNNVAMNVEDQNGCALDKVRFSGNTTNALNQADKCTGGGGSCTCTNVSTATITGMGFTSTNGITESTDWPTTGAKINCQKLNGVDTALPFFDPSPAPTPANCLPGGAKCKYAVAWAGAPVAGISDIDGDSLRDFHERVNIKSNGTGFVPDVTCP